MNLRVSSHSLISSRLERQIQQIETLGPKSRQQITQLIVLIDSLVKKSDVTKVIGKIAHG